jgi:hypothetical protein
MLSKFPFFSTIILYGKFVHHPFFGRHVPRWFVHWASFYISSLLCIMVLCGGFSFLYFPLFYWQHSHHWFGFYCLFFLTILFFNWFLWGSWFNSANVRLGCLRGRLSTFLLLPIFVTIWMVLGFWASQLDLYFSLLPSYKTQHWMRMLAM